MGTDSEDRSVRLSLLRHRFSRRILLASMGKGAVATALLRYASHLAILGGGTASAADLVYGAIVPAQFTDDERAILTAVLNHLIPSAPDSPGATDIHAAAYLEVALAGSDVDPEDLPTVRSGVITISSLSQELFKGAIPSLDSKSLETVLRSLEDRDDGEAWLTLVMGYAIEAYVGDPVYGGNPNGIVWQWLGHTPGYPRPPQSVAEKRR